MVSWESACIECLIIMCLRRLATSYRSIILCVLSTCTKMHIDLYTLICTHTQSLNTKPDKFIEAFLSNRVEPLKLKTGLIPQLKMQTMLLDKAYKSPKIVNSHRPIKRLSTREKRRLKIYDVPKKKQTYGYNSNLIKRLWLQ